MPEPQPLFSAAERLPAPPAGTVAAALVDLADAAGPPIDLGYIPEPPKPAKGRARGPQQDRARYELVAVDRIHADPDNPRKTIRNVQQLADSLKKVGLLEPVTLRVDTKNRLVLVYGQRRLAAAKHAQWTHIPAIIRTDLKDSSVLARQIQENSQRDPLEPMEEARAIRAFMRLNRIATHEQAAAELGHSQVWVSNRLALLDLDEADQERVSAGSLSIMAGAAIAREKKGTARSRRGASRSAHSVPPRVAAQRTAEMTAHFGATHPLSARARAKQVVHRCQPLPGGIACGECWEQVIRADEARG